MLIMVHWFVFYSSNNLIASYFYWCGTTWLKIWHCRLLMEMSFGDIEATHFDLRIYVKTMIWCFLHSTFVFCFPTLVRNMTYQIYSTKWHLLHIKESVTEIAYVREDSFIAILSQLNKNSCQRCTELCSLSWSKSAFMCVWYSPIL